MADETIDRYQIREKIGAGGMGTVYRAWDSEIEREVALKWLPAYFSADVTFSERFKREARVVARLEHPHIVPIYDVGENEGRPFIIMRLLSGGTLRDQTGKPSFDLAALMKMLEEVGDALAAAHARQIIHRDIKPGNILFDDNGSAFLSDFGIAKVLDSATQLTGSGFIGTPAYMSPEQFIGQGIDGRSDQYSLAIVVYETLTGNLPFQGNTAQVMYKHINAAPPVIDLDDHPIPHGLNPVLQKALSKDPNDRYARIQDFVTAMKIAVRENPEAAAAMLPLVGGGMLATPAKPATAPTALDTPAEQKGDQVQKNYSEGMEAMFREEWAVAIAAFDRVLQEAPDHSNAAEFKAQAEAYLEQTAPTPEPDEDVSGAALAAGAAVAGAVINLEPTEVDVPTADDDVSSVAATEVEYAEAEVEKTSVELPPEAVEEPEGAALTGAGAAAATAAAALEESNLDRPAAQAAPPAAIEEQQETAPAPKKRSGIMVLAIAALILLLLLCGGGVYAAVNLLGRGGEETAAGQAAGEQDTTDVAAVSVDQNQGDEGGAGSTNANDVAAAPTDTAAPEATDTATPEPTDGPAEEATAVPALPAIEETTEVPATATEAPTETAAPQPAMVRVIVSSANLRRGPGVIYRTIGPIFRDDVAVVLAKNSDGSWFNIEREDGSRAWLAASVVELVEGGDVNLVSVAATIPVAPTRTPVPPTFTPIPRPTQPPPPPPPSDGGGNGGGGNGDGGDDGGDDGGGGGGYTPEAP